MGSKYQNSNIDITNQRFGRLTAIKKVGTARWLCRCDCGNEVEVCYSLLKYVKSCGCLRKQSKERFAKAAVKHNGYGTPLYQRYCAIKQRCYNPKNHSYKRYGGRGITMCDEWEKSYESFKRWAYNNGYDPNKRGLDCSIDRIDNDKGYSPDNCRFANAQEQSLNRSDTNIFEYGGQLYSALSFAKAFGISNTAFVNRRLNHEWKTPQEVLDEWQKTIALPPYLMTLDEAALKYGKTTGHIRRMLNQGKLKGERIGWKWFVNKEQSTT